MYAEERDDRAYRALGHRDRRRLLRVIGGSARPVGELADEAGLDQPVTSQHLRVLRDAGLVTVEVDGNRRLYSIDFERLGELRRFLEDFWDRSLRDLKRIAESDPGRPTDERDR